MNKILVTGAAGFIGYHLSTRLLNENKDVFGIDNLNEYYDVSLKEARLSNLQRMNKFSFRKLALENKDELEKLFQEKQFDCVINLAAQPGVRYSLKAPRTYIDSNIVGFLNILEACRHHSIKHLVFASSSSVYGANTKMPFSIHHNVDHPVSLYAATKKANELIAHSYSSLFNLPCTGLRFFTVYGPWGRPDMAYFSFAKSIIEDRPIDVFNCGKMKRDFTYIDDIVEAVVRIVDKVPRPNPAWNGDDPDPATSYAPYKLYNVGNNKPVELLVFIEVLEKYLGKKATKNLLPMQAGDIPEIYASIDDLMDDVGFRPDTPIEQGVDNFVKWYRDSMILRIQSL